MTDPVSAFVPAGSQSSAQDQAAAWFSYLRSGQDTPEGRAMFAEWLRTDAAHAAAYREIRGAFDAIAEVEDAEERLAPPPRSAARATAPVRRMPRLGPHLLGAAAALTAVVVGLGAAGVLLTNWTGEPDALTAAAPSEPRVYATAVGDVETLSLADGSTITLSGATTLEVSLGDRRHVILTSGQAYFEVAHDIARPFTVEADGVTVEVLGTAFDVRHGSSSLAVSVTHGRVRLTPDAAAAAPSPPVFLIPGQQAVIAADGAVSQGRFDVDHVLAWRDRRFHFDDAPLCELIVDVNRFASTPVAAPDAALCERHVTASFDSAQIDQTLDAIAESLDLQLVRGPDEIQLRPDGA